MALLFADNFSYYGVDSAGRTNMLQGVWAEISSSQGPTTDQSRGQGTHSLKTVPLAGTNVPARFVFGGNLSTFYLAAAFYVEGLPSDNEQSYFFQARDNNNDPQVSIVLSSTGTIMVKRGDRDGVLIAETDAPVFVAESFQHIEVRFVISTTVGEVEVRVNEQTVLDETGLNTQATAVASCAQAVVARSQSTSPCTFYTADLSLHDESGAVNNDFLGDVQWLCIYPDADTAVTDWVRNTGSNDYDMVDQTTPDADTTYIEATVPGVQEFGLQDLPATVSEVIAVITRPMMRKSDAGTSSVEVGVVSALTSPEDEDMGTSRSITEEYVYYSDVFETDPATGIVWTPDSVNAMRLKLDRTA